MFNMPRFLEKKEDFEDTIELDELPKSIAHAHRQQKKEPIIETADKPWEQAALPVNDEIEFIDE